MDLALHRAQPGDLLVLFASDIPNVWQHVTTFKPTLDGAGDGHRATPSVAASNFL